MSNEDPTPSSNATASSSTGSKLDNLSKADLIKFAKKQFSNLTESRKREKELIDKLQSQIEHNDYLQKEVYNIYSSTPSPKLDESDFSKNLKDNINILKKTLTDLKEKSSKTDMVELEIRDLECKVDNLTKSLKEKTEKLVDAHNILSSNGEVIATLQKELKENKLKLEEVMRQNSSITTKINEEVSLSKNLKHQLAEAEKKISELYEKGGSEKLELAQTISKNETRHKLLEEAVNVLKTENKNLKDELEENMSKLNQVSKEYDEFKNKARFVLESKKKTDEDKSEYSMKLEIANKTIDELEKEKELIKNENAKKIAELSSYLDKLKICETELYNMKMSNMEIEKVGMEKLEELRSKYTKMIETVENELSVTKGSLESKQQLVKRLEETNERLEHRYNSLKQKSESTIKDLEEKIKVANDQLTTLNKEMEQVKRENDKKLNVVPKPVKTVVPIVPQPHVNVSPRIDSWHHEDESNCIEEDRTLEDILYGNIDEEPRPDMENYQSDKEIIDNLMTEVENLKKTNAHVSELLSEAESANGRLANQNGLLKSEIRRLERKETREQELSNENNLEYLKNVIIQFLQPTSVKIDRSQLIIVLQRVLHLSQEETGIVKSCAEYLNNHSENSTTWSSYFSSWTG